MSDRRTDILEAGLAVLREHGYADFTQPRVAEYAGMRQSHLTYYHPTRADLLAEVGKEAVRRQLAAVDANLDGLQSLDEIASAIARVVIIHPNTRVLLALAQVGDGEPRLAGLFQELADGFISRLETILTRLDGRASANASARLIQALVVGLAVVDLATAGSGGLDSVTAILKSALRATASEPAPSQSKRIAAPPRIKREKKR